MVLVVHLIISIMMLTINFSHGYISDSEASSTLKVIPFDNEYSKEVANLEEDERILIKYEIKDDDIYVECFVKEFSFNKEGAGQLKQDGEGHVQLYINGNKVDSIFTPSFIIKALPVGTYNIKVELVHNDYTPYGISKEFEVKL
jgi:hypothetical protein